MASTRSRIHMSPEEFLMLMVSFDAKKIWFTETLKKYEAVSSEELEELWNSCIDTLSKKNYVQKEGEVHHLSMNVQYVINECAEAEKSFFIQIIKARKVVFEAIYYQGRFGYICVENNLEHKELYFSIKSVERMCQQLGSKLVTSENTEEVILQSKKVVLSQQEFFSLQADINMRQQERIRLLLGDVLTEEEIAELVVALTENLGSLLITEGRVEFEDSSIIVLFGKRLYWLVSVDSEEKISIQMFSKQELLQMLPELFWREE